MKLRYIGMSGSCFTNGNEYLILSTVDTAFKEDHYLAVDNDGDQVYVLTTDFEQPKQKVVIAFGTEVVDAVNNLKPVDEFIVGCISEYIFESEKEKEAFLQGVEASSGWLEYQVLDDEDQKQYKDQIN